MHVDLDDIELAIEFVSVDYSLDNEAYVDSVTGEIYYCGDTVDDVVPDDIYENDKYVLIPTKRDLDLGKQLVLDFVANELPNEFNKVYAMFRARGAYGKFKFLLHSLGCTEKWYDYENKALKAAVIEWCKEYSIDYKGDD